MAQGRSGAIWRISPDCVHGKWIGCLVFTMTAVVAAVAFCRTRTRVCRMAPSVVTAYLSIILILCKSLGASVYCAVLLPLARLARPRLQLRVATIFVILAVAYPLFRTSDLVPTSYLVDSAASFSEVRAASLQFRFTNERLLLDRALLGTNVELLGKLRQRPVDLDGSKDATLALKRACDSDALVSAC